MKKKYQVFVSSTYEDLKEERMAVTQCLLDNECIPVGMEQFPASGMSQMAYIEKMLDDCDYYILILAGKYGSLDSDGIGFTEKEFDYANSKGMPIMSFVFEDMGVLPNYRCESTDEKREKLFSFRSKVCANRLVNFYTDIGSLKAAVATSINRCKTDFEAVGWVRGDSFINKQEQIPSKEEIAAMIAEQTKGFRKIHVGTGEPNVQMLNEGDIYFQIE